MSEEKKEKASSLEEEFAQIEAIIEKMEDQDVPLDESFLLYQQGVEKLRKCNVLLDEVEKKMQVLDCLEEE